MCFRLRSDLQEPVFAILIYNLVKEVFDDCDDARSNTRRWRDICVDEAQLNVSQDVHVRRTKQLFGLP